MQCTRFSSGFFLRSWKDFSSRKRQLAIGLYGNIIFRIRCVQEIKVHFFAVNRPPFVVGMVFKFVNVSHECRRHGKGKGLVWCRLSFCCPVPHAVVELVTISLCCRSNTSGDLMKPPEFLLQSTHPQRDYCCVSESANTLCGHSRFLCPIFFV